jgi:hypothetical protein
MTFYHHTEIILDNGKRAIVDATQIDPSSNDIEVMVMYPNGEEIESAICEESDVAEVVFNSFVQKYTGKPCGKYLTLAENLKAAAAYALEKVKDIPDTGTCNLDATALKLPRWNEQRVEHAAKYAGIGCFTWDCYGNKRFVFTTPNVGQAYRNEKAAEFMGEYLTAKGYDVMQYCQMD